jgi:hypothetical protein
MQWNGRDAWKAAALLGFVAAAALLFFAVRAFRGEAPRRVAPDEAEARRALYRKHRGALAERTQRQQWLSGGTLKRMPWKEAEWREDVRRFDRALARYRAEALERFGVGPDELVEAGHGVSP